MRLIDADAFDKALSDAQDKCRRNGGNFRFGVLSTVRENLANAPTIQLDEPRVMTLEEVLGNAQKIGFPCWVEEYVENIGRAVLVPAVVTSDDIYVQYTGNDYIEGAIYHWAYNKYLRCWTDRPTDEQRKAVEWDAAD